LTAGLVILLLLAGGTAAGSEKAEAVAHLEVLEGVRARTPELTSPTTPERPSGVTLVLNSLDDVGRAELARALGRLAAHIRRKRNPLFVPLDEDATGDPAESALRDLGPALTAAASLSAGRWAAADGGMTVRSVRSCARTSVCIALGFPAADGDLAARARFLAWPIGFAIVVESATPREAARTASALRAARSGSSRVALVLTSEELHSLRRSAAVTEIARYAAELARAGATDTLAPLLAALAAAPRTRDEVPSLSIPRNAILIVPRLGTLATADAFVEEVRRVLQRSPEPVIWLLSPG
jgi:hypothetical protein